MKTVNESEDLIFGQEVTFRPLEGRKSGLKLNRTRLWFTNIADFEKEPGRPVPIQSLKGHQLSYVLSFFEEKKHFILKSLNERPFELNGNTCYEAVIKQGDRVSLEYNSIHFDREKTGPFVELKIPLRVLQSSASLLFEGETGTGKSYTAKKVHQDSGRPGQFIHLNLSAYPSSLLESKLFGHNKGAFTGAIADTPGAFEMARNGTLFLDELDSVCPSIQTKLLLCLEEGHIVRVGGHQKIPINCRFIFAAGRELLQLVEKGEFRRDLYFRVTSGFSYRLNSLRENKEIIRQHMALIEKKHSIIFSQELRELYQRHDWPGNIRQLVSHLEKKVLVSPKRKITFDALDSELLQSSKRFDFVQKDGIISLDRIKRDYAAFVFNSVRRDLQVASKLLQVNPRTVRNLIGPS